MKFGKNLFGTIRGAFVSVLNISKLPECLRECPRIRPEFLAIRGGRTEYLRINPNTSIRVDSQPIRLWCNRALKIRFKMCFFQFQKLMYSTVAASQ